MEKNETHTFFLTAKIINIKLSKLQEHEKKNEHENVFFYYGMRNLSSYCLDLFIRWNFHCHLPPSHPQHRFHSVRDFFHSFAYLFAFSK